VAVIVLYTSRFQPSGLATAPGSEVASCPEPKDQGTEKRCECEQVKPAAAAAVAAAAAPPLETTSLTAEPLATLVPAAGFWLMTLREATVLLACCVTVPAVSPAPVIAVVAAACVWPTTFGTATYRSRHLAPILRGRQRKRSL
jgi:hypothetical protein